nr:hypothetical protein [Dactylosporangium vinaceum]
MTPHTSWCAGGHRCSLGEHRADPLVVDIPRQGRIALTRVRSAAGREHAEIRLTVALAVTEPHARRQLAVLLDRLTQALHEGSFHRGTVAA